MKQFLSIVILCFVAFELAAIDKFRFAFLTDLHVQMINQQSSEDLQSAVNELNNLSDIDFVLVAGDITEFGDSASLRKAKYMLDALKMPYYITLGNHDVQWTEPPLHYFSIVFGDDKFSFFHKGFYFVGFPTRPMVKNGNGHVFVDDIQWVDKELSALNVNIPIFAITHYPLQGGDVENWSEMTNVLRKYNVQAVLGGHYHRNLLFNYDQIPGIINRSTLRNKENVGGYTIYSVSDSVHVSEKRINRPEQLLLSMPVELREYNIPDVLIDSSLSTNQKSDELIKPEKKRFKCLKSKKTTKVKKVSHNASQMN